MDDARLASPADSTERPEGEPLAARIGALFGAIRTKALNLVYPPHCIGCGVATADAHAFCATCWAALPFITRPYCQRLGTPFQVDFGMEMLSPAAIADPPRFDRARAALRHAGPARDIVSRLKYSDRLDLVRPIATLMVQAGADILKEADLLVPVPMHRFRFFRRRYNQAALLAQVIARQTGLPLALDALTRDRATRAQVGLRKAERQKNVSGAFRIDPARHHLVEGRRVIVIDDVRTTGSTANACAHILRKAGATGIDILTFTAVCGAED